MDADQQLCLSRGQPFQRLSQQLEKLAAADPELYNRFCSWQDVVLAIEKAKGEDSAKAERTFLGRHLRAPLRKAAPVINTLDSLTNMIPDQNGLSILRGGLTTLFKLVHLRLETRSMILEVFDDIPDRFVKAVEAQRRFPDATDLRHAVAHLCDTLVESLGVLIPILVRTHPQKNILARLWKQYPGKENEAVQSCLAEISRASKRVKRCSTAATERTIGEMHTLLLSMSDSNSSLHGDLKVLTAEVCSGNTIVQNALQKNDTIGGREQQYTGYYLEGPRPEALLPWAPVTNMLVPSMLTAASFTQANQTLYAPPSPVPPLSPPKRIHDDLFTALDVPDHAAEDILDSVARRSDDPGLDAGARAEHLLRMGRFQTWVAAPPSVSDLIIVDGHCGNAAVDGVSPMSAISASLVEVIRDDPFPTIVLHHFCGERVGPGCLSGPRGLMRSLIQQLLQHGYLHADDAGYATQRLLDFVDDELLCGLEDHDVPSLCRAFAELFVRLDRLRPVFCVIDGVSEIETVLNHWQEDTCFIVTMLLDLVDDDSRAGPALRVLLTSPERSAKLADTVVPPIGHVPLLAARVPGGQAPLSLFRSRVSDLLMDDGMDDFRSSAPLDTVDGENEAFH